MLEFAVALPLLVVFVVGIFDFGEAFNVKQKLNNITREAARFASAFPTNDLDAIGTPRFNHCDSRSGGKPFAGGKNERLRAGHGGRGVNGATLTWTYTAAGGCPAPLILTIERGYSFQTTIGGQYV